MPRKLSQVGGLALALVLLAPAGPARADQAPSMGWGLNVLGQVGGVAPGYPTPVVAAGGHAFTRIAAGQSHGLGIAADGTVWYWGDTDPRHYAFEQTFVTAPFPVPGLTGVVAVDGGEDTSLALKSDGTVWAWGANELGQLGDGTRTHRTTPVRVSGLTGVMAVSAGRAHGMALKSDGTVWTWGHNRSGELGDGSRADRLTPVRAGTLTGITAIAAGAHFSLAVAADGRVSAWGENEQGQLGSGGVSPYRVTPGAVAGLTGVASVAAGSQFALALRGDGQVWGWGANSNGQLGDGTTVGRPVPVKVPLGPAQEVGAGAFHGVARVGGSVHTWGSNSAGQLGTPSVAQRSLPGPVASLTGIRQLAVGGPFTVVLTSG
ncbi:hypothetical protein Aph01nite_47480 [Acrocarpospora phusangensis]|uniref:RCC1-like domain-containing protein n=1 Tax=Acrocarpospora phusangensis TaxID=1070424 RepID=A0A919QCZ9_9ACTN|nr:hypothetical protein [Acrocarpospora phusangensis]GIH26438.1 hypothetical protein Aph01nite_47480 [Acrocarpospora phusangensis]